MLPGGAVGADILPRDYAEALHGVRYHYCNKWIGYDSSLSPFYVHCPVFWACICAQAILVKTFTQN